MKEEKNTVLVVDDDLQMLKTAALLLSEQYVVSLARSGREALDMLCGGERPDLILLDVRMPELDGYETIQAIHQLLGEATIPVIFLTGLTEEEDELKGLQLGAVDYIRKPFSREILLARIFAQIKNQQRIRERLSSGMDEERERDVCARLTATEWRIVQRMMQGYTGKEISEQLHYSYSYVKKAFPASEKSWTWRQSVI